MLAMAYLREVHSRGREAILDDETQDHICELAEVLTSPMPRCGILLTGSCGVGKTTLMYAFRRVLNILSKEKHFSFLDEYFVPAMQIIHANDLGALFTEKNMPEFIKHRNASMLGIDDLGEEPAVWKDYGNDVMPLVRLLEHRYQNQLFTFITTNLDGDMLLDRYKERIYDRFMEMFHIIAYEDGSYRQ